METRGPDGSTTCWDHPDTSHLVRLRPRCQRRRGGCRIPVRRGGGELLLRGGLVSEGRIRAGSRPGM